MRCVVILLIDNYDSFVHNLARYFERLGQTTRVVRNDVASPAWIRKESPAAIVLSPGPCTPNEAGYSLEIVRQLHHRFPILGICLGHQAIAQAFGGRIVRAREPMHGRTSPIDHWGEGVFRHVPSPMTACRYHSLIVERESLPISLQGTATTPDGVIMAIRHRTEPVFGLQFHPESILTEHGFRILANFLHESRLPAKPLPDFETEFTQPREPASRLPNKPLTF